MKRVNAFLPVTALALILAGCNAGTSSSGAVADKATIPADGVDFRIKANKGDVANFQISMKMDGKGPAEGGAPSEIKVDIGMKQTVKVTDVKDGNYSVEVKSSDVKATGTAPVAEMFAQQFKNSVGKLTIDSKGRVVNQEGSVDSAMGSGGTLYFPDKKVKVGDTWERAMPTAGGGTANVKYRFEGAEAVGGKTYAKISIKPVSQGVETTGQFDFLVDMDNGMIFNGDGSITSKVGGGSMVVTMKMERI
jgi:hypothetical protein